MNDRRLFNAAVAYAHRALVADGVGDLSEAVEALDAAIADLRLWRQHVRARISGDHPSSSNAVRAENAVGGGPRDEGES